MSLSEAALELYVIDAPRETFGALLLGTEPAMIASGEGSLCVGGTVTCLALLATNTVGNAVLDLSPTLQTQFQAGQPIHVQYIFRDPLLGGASGFNYSNALVGTFCP